MSLFFPLMVVYLSRAPPATVVSAVVVLFSSVVVKYCEYSPFPEDPEEPEELVLPPVSPLSVPLKS